MMDTHRKDEERQVFLRFLCAHRPLVGRALAVQVVSSVIVGT
jgi:hypothetical protein